MCMKMQRSKYLIICLYVPVHTCTTNWGTRKFTWQFSFMLEIWMHAVDVNYIIRLK